MLVSHDSGTKEHEAFQGTILAFLGENVTILG
jgi:hypothetical protein